MLWTWRFLHLRTCDMLRKSWGGLGGWGGDDDVSFTSTHVTCYSLDVSCACTHVTCYASHGEGWVGGVGMMTFLLLAHMLRTWRFLHLHTCDMLRKSWGGLQLHVALQQPKLVEAARTIVPTTLTKGKHECEWFFFSVLPTSQFKIAKIELRTQFWRVFYTSVKIQNRKKRGNKQWFWYDPCFPKCKLPGVTNNAGIQFATAFFLVIRNILQLLMFTVFSAQFLPSNRWRCYGQVRLQPSLREDECDGMRRGRSRTSRSLTRPEVRGPQVKKSWHAEHLKIFTANWMTEFSLGWDPLWQGFRSLCACDASATPCVCPAGASLGLSIGDLL